MAEQEDLEVEKIVLGDINSNIDWASHLRRAGLVVVPVLLAAWFAYYAAPFGSPDTLAELKALGVPASGHGDGHTLLHGSFKQLARSTGSMVPDRGNPDTTAVVLNWSRLPNVVLIVSLLCAPCLRDVISEIVVWNNNPVPISHRDFASAKCLSKKLRIHNSPQNLYFHARFLACASASTPFCYIQDDDYLVQPDIVRTLHARISEAEDPHSIFILPPHEHLTSTLRETHTHWTNLHTSFSWLGHGAMIPRSEAVDFLDALKSLNASNDEVEMADNYFSILRNKLPEIWHDHRIELGGGVPFTLGAEGEERNNRHIMRALEYLDELGRRNSQATIAYVHTGPPQASPFPNRAPCLGAVCLLESNIPVLPRTVQQKSNKAVDMLSLETHNRFILGDSGVQHYLDHPLSLAVDGKLETSFVSSANARAGQWVSLDLVSSQTGAEKVAMLWLIDRPTEDILKSCVFEVSRDGRSWLTVETDRSCLPVGKDSSELAEVVECRVELTVGDPFRFARARLLNKQSAKWRIYEVWMGTAL